MYKYKYFREVLYTVYPYLAVAGYAGNGHNIVLTRIQCAQSLLDLHVVQVLPFPKKSVNILKVYIVFEVGLARVFFNLLKII